jgi:hypothetical protein
MKADVDKMTLAAAVLFSSAVFALEFTTECASGHSTHTPSDNKYTPAFVRKVYDSCYLGKVNSSHCNTYLWAGLPTNFCTSAEIVCPVSYGQTIKGANIDIWMLGIENKLGDLTYNQKVWWHTWDDTTSVRTNSEGQYVYLLDNRLPVKIQDNAIQDGISIGSSPAVFKPEGLMTQIGLLFNRGATTNDYMMLRFNPDKLDMTGNIRFVGGTTAIVAESNKLAGAEIYSTQYIRYSSPDNIPSTISQLSAGEQESETYIRSAVKWVQYRDSDGSRGFSYPAYCGVKDGKTRDLYFAIDAPAYTLTNAWLTLNALPPFTGSVPQGARVSLSLVGFADAPSDNTDFVVTDAMFADQTPIVLQEDVIQGEIYAGKQLLSRRSAQRDLIRALNARVVSLSKLWAEKRTGQKAVFCLQVEDAGGTADWGFSIGSVATPGAEAFFEGIEYRKKLTISLPNSDFESGLSNWTVSPDTATANQISVVEDPLVPGNHCLRFKGVDTPKEMFSVSQWMYDDKLVRSLRSRAFKMSCRAYFPQKLLRRDGDTLTLYGFFYQVTKNENNSSVNIDSVRWADDYKEAGKWLTVEYTDKVFLANQTSGFSFSIRFECSKPCDLNMGDEAYIDDLYLTTEDFFEYPKEQNAFIMVVR